MNKYKSQIGNTTDLDDKKPMAKKKPMESITTEDLGMNAEELGLQGSMTQVLKFEKPESRKEGERFEGEETETVPMALQKLVSEAKLAV